MSVKKLTPVLLVTEIEPCAKFWERVGFTRTVEVPESPEGGNKLGFVILNSGPVELMYQTYASVERDAPAQLAGVARGPTFLYVEVESIKDTLAAMKGVPISMQMRASFYGAQEFGVKDPAGHSVTFAEFAAAEK
jgi:uncharacterized glyoxalase superfamily protein PhnB